MAKRPNYVPTERVDLDDFLYSVADYPFNLQSDMNRAVLGAGVLEGFRVRVLEQSGANKGRIEISNGRALDWGGRFLNAETGTIAEQVVLSGVEQEFWVEVEILFIDADKDARALWDALIDNTAPLPDGQEVSVPRVPTRKIPTWRIKQPIRSNPADKRTESGYNPVGFSPSTEHLVRVACIRTNSSGHIVFGSPDDDEFGNAIVTRATAEGSSRKFIQAPGLGEPTQQDTSGFDLVYGYKHSDQRNMFFSPLLPPGPLGFSPPGDIAGSIYNGMWMRDMGSCLDHLMTQIGQIKDGAGPTDFGQYHDGLVQEFGPNLEYLTLKEVYDNSSSGSPFNVDPDQFIGCTIQVTSGHWAGFYAEIQNNERTALDGTTKLWLGRKSGIPEWRDGIAGNPTCRVVQHKQKNWLAPPTPDSANRGLNALDTEVVGARTDYWSNIGFTYLRNRLDAGKLATLTVAPEDTPDLTTGDPSTAGHPRADVFYDNANIRATVKAVAEDKGGRIHFRQGTYDFVDQEPATTVFELSGAEGVIFEGEGPDKTILKYINTSSPVETRTIFSLANCQDIIFKDMKFHSTGTPFQMTGCSRIFFINCEFEGDFVDADTPVVDLGSALFCLFDSCRFYVVGEGLSASSFGASMMRYCRFFQRTALSTQLKYAVDLGKVEFSHVEHNYFSGYSSEAGVQCENFTSSHFNNNIFASTVASGGDGQFYVWSRVEYSLIVNNTMRNDSSVADNQTFAAMKLNRVVYSKVEGLIITGVKGGVSITDSFTYSYMGNIRAALTPDALGITVGGTFENSVIDRCYLRHDGGTSARGIYLTGRVYNGFVVGNDIRGSASIGNAIEIASNDVNNAVIKGNIIDTVNGGIYINGATSGTSLFIHDNLVRNSSVAAFYFKFNTFMEHVSIVGNKAPGVSNLGMAFDVTGTNLGQFLISGNTIVATGRALEVLSTSGGYMIYSQITNNLFSSANYSPVAIGTTATSAVPTSTGAPGTSFEFQSSLFKHNICHASGSTLGNLWFAYLDKAVVDNNLVVGNQVTRSLQVVEYLQDSSISLNMVQAWTNPASGIYLETKSDGKVRLIGNHVMVERTGASGIKGIYLYGTATAGGHVVANNQCFGPGQSETGSRGFDLANIQSSTIVGNYEEDFQSGYHCRDADNCMVSGNMAKNNDDTVGYYVFTDATRCRGGSLITGVSGVPAAPTGFFGDPGPGAGDARNSISPYNMWAT